MDKIETLKNIEEVLESIEKDINDIRTLGKFVESLRDEAETQIQSFINYCYLERFEEKRHSDVKRFITDIIDDLDRSDEINLTYIAEQTCDEFNVNFQDGPLDDSDHWIWDDIEKYIDLAKEELEEDD